MHWLFEEEVEEGLLASIAHIPWLFDEEVDEGLLASIAHHLGWLFDEEVEEGLLASIAHLPWRVFDEEVEEGLLDIITHLPWPFNGEVEDDDQLLYDLDGIVAYLSWMKQSPPKSFQTILTLAAKELFLVSEVFLEHSNIDIKVSVACCISEITRITAPDLPFDDDTMKDVFQLIVSSFENLDDISSTSHENRATILDIVARERLCFDMLDLECDQMIADMFQHFLKAIRSDHDANIIGNMETIMNDVIEESENISPDLLAPILSTLRRNNQDASPIARKLAENVIQSSAHKLRPYLRQAVTSVGTSFDEYNEVVASVCQENTVGHSN